MMSSFLSLLKEEPTEGTDMDSSNGHMTMSRPMPPPVVSEPPLQGLSPLTPGAMQPTPVIMRDIDPNFEPVSRGRSNTWPLLPEGFMESDESSVVDPTASGEAQRLGGGASLLETPGGPPKKNTSRRNPWGNMSYADLIAQAIASSPEGRATLSQIYDWMVQNVPYFKDKGDSNSSAGWKNSIRHNLSLHNRFMRMQNEGTGKSSWWVLNPDAKPGKSTRRRANTLEGGNRMEKKRGRVRKKEGMRNSIEAPPSPNLGEGMEYFPGSPTTASLHHQFQLSPQDYRPRASSNASSCGRLTPIPSVEADMHDSQVPPLSPGPVWPEFWPGNNHIMNHHMGRHLSEHYTEHLAESMGEGLKLGSRDSWGPHHVLGPHTGSSDCLKTASHPHHHHHINGFLSQPHNQHPPGYVGYDDYNTFMPPNSQCGGSTFPHNQNLHHPPKEKLSMRRHPRSFPGPPPLQVPSAHNVSIPMGEPQFPPSLEQDASLTPPFSNSSTISCNSSNNITNRLTPSSSHQPITSSSSNRDGVKEEPSSTGIPTPVGSMTNISSHNPANHHNQHSCESTTMLRVALSHRDASSYSINGVSHYRNNGAGQAPNQSHSSGGSNDLVDLDTIHGGLECNVEEVLKHELQYEDQLTFDLEQQQGPSYAHSHAYPHREGTVPQIGAPPGSVPVYNTYSSIPNGNNQWVR